MKKFIIKYKHFLTLVNLESTVLYSILQNARSLILLDLISASFKNKDKQINYYLLSSYEIIRINDKLNGF